MHAVACSDELASVLAHKMIVFEVESALRLVEDGCHGGLTHSRSACLLGCADLLFYIVGVVVLQLLESIIKQRAKNVRSYYKEFYRLTYVFPPALTIRDAFPVAFSNGSGKYGLVN